MRIAGYLRASSRAPLSQVAKTSLATVLAWLVSTVVMGEPLPIFAAIAALLVVQPSVNQSISRGIERSIGVILGVLLASAAAAIFAAGSWIVLAVVVAALLLGWVLRLSPSSATQIPISAMLMLSIGAATPNYAFERVLETMIGAAVAMTVNVTIAPPVLLVPAHVAVSRLLRECAATLEHLARSLREPQDAASLEELLVHARSLRSLESAASAAIATGEESLTLNPRRAAHRRVLERESQLLGRGRVLARRILGMSRAFRDHYDANLHNEPTVSEIARELSRASHDLVLLANENDPPPATTPRGKRGTAGSVTAAIVSEDGNPASTPIDDDLVPALTAPLMIPRPHPQHWVLIGSLMEDMRRVREEITGEADG
ncbi:fusaric acid resistance family protein [Glaciihabitans tibetensis]|uniref:Fusaric acid resistance family protein n=1 Tax=Glaciihabitans tibetensis TaxID=1266600 RepID=A0A2T0VIX8_9MICO|nr:FUSC family protein [Glaciihabitans tibetensis]PRY70177.1 fusaric acid resistance family protein [Glaciihabitans tibetensis]